MCHSRDRIDREDEDLEGWTAIVTRMQGYGAQLSDQEKQTLIAYLTATHGKVEDNGDHGGERDQDRDGDDD